MLPPVPEHRRIRLHHLRRPPAIRPITENPTRQSHITELLRQHEPLHPGRQSRHGLVLFQCVQAQYPVLPPFLVLRRTPVRRHRRHIEFPSQKRHENLVRTHRRTRALLRHLRQQPPEPLPIRRRLLPTLRHPVQHRLTLLIHRRSPLATATTPRHPPPPEMHRPVLLIIRQLRQIRQALQPPSLRP